MPKTCTRLPTVFVAHPLDGRFAVKKLRSILRELPFRVAYGNTNLQTRYLLSIMKSSVSRSDFDFKPESGLGYQLVRYILAKEYWIRRLWKEIPEPAKGARKGAIELLRKHKILRGLGNSTTYARGRKLFQE